MEISGIIAIEEVNINREYRYTQNQRMKNTGMQMEVACSGIMSGIIS
jgi:energy-converting hydrogenase Eha subunit G